MLRIAFSFLIILACLDFCAIDTLREFLWDFLSIKRNKLAMRRNLAQQTRKDQITMNYIGPLLKKNQKPFRVWHCVYLSVIYSLLPQYVILLIVLFTFKWLFLPLAVPLCIVKIVILFSVRSNQDNMHISKYSRYYKKWDKKKK